MLKSENFTFLIRPKYPKHFLESLQIVYNIWKSYKKSHFATYRRLLQIRKFEFWRQSI